jgi:hypothetical protein
MPGNVGGPRTRLRTFVPPLLAGVRLPNGTAPIA